MRSWRFVATAGYRNELNTVTTGETMRYARWIPWTIGALVLAAAVAVGSLHYRSGGGDSSGDSVAAAAVPNWTLHPVARVDGERHLLGSLWRARLAPNGDLVVMLPNEKQLMVVSPSGEVRGRIAGPGQGPGELVAPRNFGFLGDTIWVADLATRRLTMFSPEGKVIATIPYVESGSEAWWLAMMPEAPPVETGRDLLIMEPLALAAGGMGVAVPQVHSRQAAPHPEVPLQLIGRDMRVVRTIAMLPRSEVSYESRGSGGRETRYLQPYFGGELLGYGASPGGLRVAILTADYGRGKIRIVQLTLMGDTISDHSLDFSPRIIGDEHVAKAAKEVALQNERPGDEQAIHAAMKLFPAAARPYHLTGITDDGTVWLDRVSGMKLFLREISANGVVLGEVEYSINQHPLAFESGHIWMSELDDNDVPSITRYRIVR